MHGDLNDVKATRQAMKEFVGQFAPERAAAVVDDFFEDRTEGGSYSGPSGSGTIWRHRAALSELELRRAWLMVLSTNGSMSEGVALQMWTSPQWQTFTSVDWAEHQTLDFAVSELGYARLEGYDTRTYEVANAALKVLGRPSIPDDALGAIHRTC